MGVIKEYRDASGLLGLMGHKWVATGQTGEATHTYCALQASEATTLSYLDEATNTQNNDVTIPTGMTIYGRLKNITVTGGNVICYIGKT